jgi:hypothetical protein
MKDDPCHLGRHNKVYSPPRELIEASGVTLKEMPRNSARSMCCGAGGAQMWMEEKIGKRINLERTDEASSVLPVTGGGQIATGCPFCKVMFTDGLTARQNDPSTADQAGCRGHRRRPDAPRWRQEVELNSPNLQFDLRMAYSKLLHCNTVPECVALQRFSSVIALQHSSILKNESVPGLPTPVEVIRCRPAWSPTGSGPGSTCTVRRPLPTTRLARGGDAHEHEADHEAGHDPSTDRLPVTHHRLLALDTRGR